MAKSRTLEFLLNNQLVIVFTMITAFISVSTLVAIPAFGQASTSYVDFGHSYSRLFIGSQENPYSFNLAVAQISGNAHLDFENPNLTTLDVNIYPAGTNPKRFSESTPAGDIKLEFVARHTVMTDKGLAMTGDLLMLEVERSVSAELNEAYTGPVYGEPVLKTTQRQITFLLPKRLSTTGAGEVHVSAIATVPREMFPALLPAITRTDWPPMVVDQKCQMPSTVGEDYSGPSCTGFSIETYSNPVAAVPSIAEDFHGFESAPPAGNQVTIVVNLALLDTRSASNWLDNFHVLAADAPLGRE